MTSTAAPAAPSHSAGRLPPGPPWPRTLQTLAFILAAPRFLEASRRSYGGAVTFRTLFDDGFVMVFDPELVRQVFQGDHEQLNAGEANALLGPILGQRSVLLLDGREHLRHRRLMLPPFHGSRLQGYRSQIQEAADAEIDGWPVGEPFPILPSMQALTLRVILGAVFGFQEAGQRAELARRLREMIEPVTRGRGLLMMALMTRLGRRGPGGGEFARARAAVDELLFEEIAARRSDPRLSERSDAFSALLRAQDEQGRGLTDQEVRDELVTLLVAGHETTATGLAFAFDLLLHEPRVLAEARRGEAPYLDAVIKEALRLAPVIPGVGRVVRGKPFRLGDHLVPVGTEINPSIRMIHSRADLYPGPRAFRPERHLGADAPDTYTWLPFGGGTRRCLGASFALLEMAEVMRRVLERTELRAHRPRRDRVVFRAITLAPKAGVWVVQDGAPRPSGSTSRRAGPL